MQKVRLEISGIAYSQTQSGSYVLTLSEAAGNRKLPIVIGGFEAQAIAVELEKMIPNRPLTHDLIKSFCVTYDVVIKEVLIYKFVEGVFFSKLICEKDGKEIIDCSIDGKCDIFPKMKLENIIQITQSF